ncbi:MAG: hypothetical protein M4579_005643 [Chaenotheca gracillima]|nr:MAG: hypothetical protein M4579_005643 [Chaenotheca gracillima]
MAFGKKEPLRWKNFFICFAIALGNLCFGYTSSITSPTFAKPEFLTYMNIGDTSGAFYPDKENVVGAITSVFQAGAVLGPLSSTHINDKWGRKAAMTYCALLAILGGAGQAGSQNIAQFIVFRFFAGAGSWGFLACSPVYCTELAPPAYRGFFVGMSGVTLGLGYAIANYWGLAFYYDPNKVVGWRAPLAFQVLWPALIIVVMFFVPESPRYLLMIGKKEKAWEVVESLHKDPGDADDEFARREFYQMSQQAEHDRKMNSSWLEMFRRPSYRRRTIFAMLYLMLTQSTAVLVIANFEPTFYSELGFGTLDILILECGRNSIAFVGNLAASLIIDRFGRRILMLIGLAGCIVCISIEAAMVAQFSEAATNKVGLGWGVAALYVFLVFFAMGMDAPGWVMLSEIFPNFLRAKGMALAVAAMSISDIVYLQVTPTAFANIGWRYFMVFISVSAVGWVWLYFTAPETNGIPLEEIAAIFGDKEDIMVYQEQIHVDRNTHKLVVENTEGQVEQADELIDAQKGGFVHTEMAEGKMA